ncbi:MAG: metal-dependent transcriptional regulator [Lachnospiraceae bacterium]|nr:metal-dependent transcriptional regulator [Lachnospiraceae bacterium]
MQLLESGEMYLETILILSEEGTPVRSIDISDRMGFSKPSVSRAMSRLKNDGYIETDRENRITLTEAGRSVAEKIYSRHRILTSFLVSLGVSEETASADACKIEHDISDETFEAIRKYRL